MLPLPRHDRLAHFWYGSNISFVVLLILRLLRPITPLADLAPVASSAISMIVCGAFALGKEIRDRLRNRRAMKAGLPPPHAVERADIAWTIYGGACVSIPAMFSLY